MAKKRKQIQIKEKDSKLIVFLITFLSIVGFIIYLLVQKKDEYTKFYAKQSLVVFIAAVIAGIIGWTVMWIPVLGWIIKGGLNIVILVLWVLSWVYALSGNMKEVPLIGHYSRNISL